MSSFLSDLPFKCSSGTVCMFGLAWMVSFTQSQNELQALNVGTSPLENLFGVAKPVLYVIK